MKIYSLNVTFTIYSDELGPDDKRQFSKIIPVPFVPYLLNGKTGHIIFKDLNGYERELPFKWGKVKWSCDGTKNGTWDMWMECHPPKFCGRSYAEVIATDIRFKNR
jgi:hypothetical protein